MYLDSADAKRSTMNLSKQPKVLAIVGPTASGKSALGVVLAKKFRGEIISADSRQVYRGFDIGTGKITKREMQGVPHHLLDIASPKTVFTAHDFLQRGHVAIEKIARRGHLPIVVGGTGFYIDTLLGTVALSDVSPNRELRKRFENTPADELFALLQKADPARARHMNTQSERSNRVRLVRALEIAAAKLRPAQIGKNRPPYDVLWVGIMPPFKELEAKIQTRLKARIRRGMIAEAKHLHAEGLSYKRMEALGLEYRALARLLQKKISRSEFEEELYRDIRAYAKRQITYWKRNKKIRWFDPANTNEIERLTNAWLAQ